MYFKCESKMVLICYILCNKVVSSNIRGKYYQNISSVIKSSLFSQTENTINTILIKRKFLPLKIKWLTFSLIVRKDPQGLILITIQCYSLVKSPCTLDSLVPKAPKEMQWREGIYYSTCSAGEDGSLLAPTLSGSCLISRLQQSALFSRLISCFAFFFFSAGLRIWNVLLGVASTSLTTRDVVVCSRP